MALLSELVTLGAELGIDKESTLAVFARRLREAGRLSQSGRGRGAAHMSYLDGSRFLIACLATDHPERAADAEQTFSNIIDDDGRTLDIAVAQLLEGLASGEVDAEHDRGPHPHIVSLPPICWVIVRRGGLSADFRRNDERIVFWHREMQRSLKAIKDLDPAAREAGLLNWNAEASRFRTAKNLTAEFGLSILRPFADLIDGKEQAAS